MNPLFIFLLILLLTFLILLVNIFNYRIPFFGSDHFWHTRMIELIKFNHHRFVTHYTHLVDRQPVQYPLLFHFLLSFFKINNVQRVNFIYRSIIQTADLAFFGFFLYLYWPGFFLKDDLYLILLPFLFLLFTPFNFVRWNASNLGFSARSLGLLIGRAFVYLFILYQQHPSYYWLAGLVVASYLIYISSQFAAQFMIFFCFIIALITLNIYLFLIPFAGFLVFYVLHRQIAIHYLKGQYQHKKVYALHLARRFILKYRPSIWRDLVYDFWIKLRKEKAGALTYIQYNSVITLFWGFTLLPLVLYAYIRNLGKYPGEWIHMVHTDPLLQVVLVSLLIFLMTSFRFTRFLGEPERYIEFVNPVIILLFIRSYNDKITTPILMAYYMGVSIFLLLANRIYDRHTAYSKKNPVLLLSEGSGEGSPPLKNLLDNLKKEHGGLRIFSNNEEVTRRLVTADHQFLIPEISAEKTGPFNYTDIYHEHYPYVNESLLLPMISTFHINVFIADKDHLIRPMEEIFQDIKYTCCYSLLNFSLLYIES